MKKKELEDIQQHYKWENITTFPRMNDDIKRKLEYGDYYSRYAIKRITELESSVDQTFNKLQDLADKDLINSKVLNEISQSLCRVD
ncbi:hypothetical protein P4V41_07655 [Fictibacillus nanhaiensis]|uniref:hypothetical protein n=1 Tax=Fictibacillus nanhaiensis TaxID=742169 RepID=UPI002E1BEA1D|nr:hypothetical protein [Fictibacillus nanhaiensis]